MRRTPPRVIEYPDTEDSFASNRIVTSHYTWYNFIPLNLFEQFHRLVNVFFLFLAIIQAIPSISPLNQSAGFVQLIVMLSITGVKQAYEDFLKHRSDKKTNERKIKRWCNGTVFDVEWQNIKVGDAILVECDGEFPCDCLIIEAESGVCRVETAALDGETNLKARYAINVEGLKDRRFRLEVSEPTASLKDFSGRIVVDGESQPLALGSFVPRGCILRGSDVLAVACYTGDDTKLMMNSIKPRFKYTELDRIMLVVSAILLTAMLLVCAGMAIGHYFWSVSNKLKYLENVAEQNYFLDFFSWIIDLQMILPLAVYSSLDIVRFLTSLCVQFDKQMTEDGKISKCRNSDLVSTIGRVTHAFCDKTGTLTKNLMTFRAVAFQNALLGLDSTRDKHVKSGIKVSMNRAHIDWVTNNNRDPDIRRMLLTICLSTMAEVEAVNNASFPTWDVVRDDPYIITYQTSSPDELALLHFARECGFILYRNSEQRGEVIINGVLECFDKLMVFEFTSARKRSSVVTKIDTEFVMLTKGADTVMRDRSLPPSEALVAHLNSLGSTGLRTLVFGYCVFENVESEIQRYSAAKAETSNSLDLVEAIGNEIETSLTMYAVTGVEDELQDDVFNTLLAMKRANIKLWMLTGDRLDAALAIAKNSGMIDESQHIMYPNQIDLDREYQDKVLVLDDASILKQSVVFDVAVQCSGVIVARCDPSEKGHCVSMFKDRRPKSVVMAVGDGVNDVDMIRKSDVGIGVEGREGCDAVLSSDFSIPSFRFLARLLLVHGRFFAIRTYLLVMVTFYKNLLLGLPQFFYGHYNGYSATSAFDSGYFAMYNTILTIPQHFYACAFEEDVDPKLVLEYPEVYTETQNNGGFDIAEVFWMYVISFLHAGILFFVAYYDLNNVVLNDDSLVLDHAVFTQVIGWNVMFVFTYELFVQFRSLSIVQLLLYAGCLLSNIVIQLAYSYADHEFWNILSISFSAPRIWLEPPFVLMFSLLIDLCKIIITRSVRPKLRDILLEKEHQKRTQFC